MLSSLSNYCFSRRSLCFLSSLLSEDQLVIFLKISSSLGHLSEDLLFLSAKITRFSENQWLLPLENQFLVAEKIIEGISTTFLSTPHLLNLLIPFLGAVLKCVNSLLFYLKQILKQKTTTTTTTTKDGEKIIIIMNIILFTCSHYF